MVSDPDSWDDPRGAEIYAEIAASGQIYRRLSTGLIELVGACPGPILDLACGTAIGCSLLAARGSRPTTIVGVDQSQEMLSVARREVPLEGVAFVRAAADRLPFRSGCFGGAICSAAFWHFPAPLRVFRELRRVLARGASFSFNVPFAQIDGESEDPSPLQRQLAAVGSEMFGRSPSPAGPRRTRRAILADAQEAGLLRDAERVLAIEVPQRELLDILSVPAIGNRVYPDADERGRRAWIANAARAVDLDEIVTIRWWQATLRAGAPAPA